MENLKVNKLVDICEKLGLILGRVTQKQAILEIMRVAEVTSEKVDEAWAYIKACREAAERREVHERYAAERCHECDEAISSITSAQKQSRDKKCKVFVLIWEKLRGKQTARLR